MNTDDVITRVKRIFGDESAVQLEDADIIRWINDAQREIVMHNEGVLETTAFINTTVDEDEYAFPSDLFILRSLRYKNDDMQSYNRLQYYNLAEFDNYINGWDGTAYGSKDPQVYTTYDRTIFVFPRPDKSTTNGLKVLYSSTPVDVTVGSDPLGLPLEYHNAIVKYATTKAYEMDEDYESSGLQFAQFQGDVATLGNREKYGAREFYPTITTRWEDTL